MEPVKGRIELIDAIRGGDLLVMIAHHVCYDLCAFCGFPWVWFSNPVWNVVHYLSAGTFILLAGVSANFSRSNVRRGLRALAVALVISAVTIAMGMPIVFGVLHLLGCCMVLYGLTQGFWRRLPAWAIPALSLAGTVATARLVNGYPTTAAHLWMLGLTTPDFVSTDYFPLLPWAFVFLFGTWAGKYIRAGRLPPWFYRAKAPRLAALGRHSLGVYVAHQPVIYALTMLAKYVFHL